MPSCCGSTMKCDIRKATFLSDVEDWPVAKDPSQLALDFAQLKAEEESPAELVLSYSPDEGVLVCGATRKWKDAIKGLAFRRKKFRFSRNLPEDCAWYAPRTRDTVVDPVELEQLAAALRRAGPTVEVKHSSKRLTFGEREKARAERAGARLERREQRAERLRQKSEQEWEGSREATRHIPVGQPILVGHHSERKHRAAEKKSRRLAERSLETQKEATRAASRARGAARREAQRTDPGVMHRRVKRLETELRKVRRSLYGHPGKGTTLRQEPAKPGAHRDKLAGMERELEAEIAYWREQLEQLHGEGLKQWGAKDFMPGDAVQGRHGWAVVKRASPKSLTVAYVNPALRRMPDQKLTYEYVEGKVTPDAQRLLAEVYANPGTTQAHYAKVLGWDESESLLKYLEHRYLVERSGKHPATGESEWRPAVAGPKRKATKARTATTRKRKPAAASAARRLITWKRWADGLTSKEWFKVADPDLAKLTSHANARHLRIRKASGSDGPYVVYAEKVNEPGEEFLVSGGWKTQADAKVGAERDAASGDFLMMESGRWRNPKK